MQSVLCTLHACVVVLPPDGGCPLGAGINSWLRAQGLVTCSIQIWTLEWCCRQVLVDAVAGQLSLHWSNPRQMGPLRGGGTRHPLPPVESMPCGVPSLMQGVMRLSMCNGL